MSKRGRKKTKPSVIKIDLSEWELGGWPEDISSIVKVDTSYGIVSISIDLEGEAFVAVARKIAKEAIEAFFQGGGGVLVELTPSGLEFDDESSKVLLPFDDMFVSSKEAIAVFRKWLTEREGDFEPDEEGA